MSSVCPSCKKGQTLYRCPTCGAAAHVDVKKREMVIHLPEMKLPTSNTPFSTCFPSHPDCELGKSVDQVDLSKLVKVEVKK